MLADGKYYADLIPEWLLSVNKFERAVSFGRPLPDAVNSRSRPLRAVLTVR
jgi:hypothetical protein